MALKLKYIISVNHNKILIKPLKLTDASLHPNDITSHSYK